MNKEKLWLDRLRAYVEKHRDVYVATWWLRLEYENETPTAQINYWLNKSVAKGILAKEANCYCTKYWIV